MRLLRLLIAAGILATALGAYASSPTTSGFLEGHLKILSSKAVNLADDNSPKPDSPAYEEYPLVVLSSDGGKEVAQLTADEHGHYRVALPPGQYILDVKGRRPGRLNATPHPFAVVAQQVVRVDMEIDTGLNRPVSNSR